MAGEIPDLEAQVRAGTGKGAARQARRDGMVPGIVFGGDKEPLPINIPFNKLLTKLRAGRFKATLFNLSGPPISTCSSTSKSKAKKNAPA